LRHAELLFQVLDTPFKSMLYPEQQSKGNQEDAVSGTVFAHGRSGDCGRVTGNSDVTRLGKSFAWACGPPIDMKIKSSRNVYDQGAWNGKDRGNPGLSEAV
jgi:hypothetical protein